MEEEQHARQNCKYLLMVINNETRGIASMVEAGSLLNLTVQTNRNQDCPSRGPHQTLLLCVEDMVVGTVLNDKEMR